MTRIINGLFAAPWNKRLTLVVLGLISIGGVAFVLYITDIAPWAYSDSAAYITTARNIAAGRGIVLQDSNNVYTLLPLHAPLYPLTLSLPILMGMDALQASRWLNAILFGLTISQAGLATFRFTRSFWLAVSVAGLILFSYEPIVAFTGAMAEGLFIFFGLLSLVLVATAIHKTSHQNRILVFGGIAAGLAILSRYTGLSVLAAGFLAVFLLVKGNFGHKLMKALIFAVPGGVLAGFWLLPVYLSTRTFGSRQIGEISGVTDKISIYFNGFMEVIGGWLPFYYRGNHIITPTQKLIIAFVFMMVLFVIAARKIHKRDQPYNENGLITWGLVLASFCIAYIGLHLTTFVTAAAQPDINGRLLLPIFIAGVLLAAAAVSFINRALPKAWLGGATFLLLTLVTLWYFHGKVETFVFEMHNYGQGYTSHRWNENPIFENITSLRDAPPLYSNNPALVLLYTERFPKELTLDSSQTAYDLDISEGAALILFNDITQRDLGEAYDGFLTSVMSRYQISYQNPEGFVFVPR
ncbi:MAG: ArnT family glycosyltransferase [Bellilinea sp.]